MEVSRYLVCAGAMYVPNSGLASYSTYSIGCYLPAAGCLKYRPTSLYGCNWFIDIGIVGV